MLGLYELDINDRVNIINQSRTDSIRSATWTCALQESHKQQLAAPTWHLCTPIVTIHDAKCQTHSEAEGRGVREGPGVAMLVLSRTRRHDRKYGGHSPAHIQPRNRST